MTVQVLLFARYREQSGEEKLTLELPEGASIRKAAQRLETTYPDLTLRGALAAVNEVYASPDDTLTGGDTLAFLPPVAGG